jgi:hypothetical protein
MSSVFAFRATTITTRGVWLSRVVALHGRTTDLLIFFLLSSKFDGMSVFTVK